MVRVLTCLAVEHDYRLVLLAAVICILSSHVAILLLGRAQSTVNRARWIWLATAGAAGGFGIWATHFIAMLAYDPGVIVGYGLPTTLASLAIAILTTSAALTWAVEGRGRAGFLGAGVLFGFGVAGMHFAGMAAIEFPGTISWDRSLVIVSIALAVLLAVPAFHVAQLKAKGSGVRNAVATALLTLSVVSLHFTAMGSITVIPEVGETTPSDLLSPSFLVVTIAAVSFSLLASGLAAALFAVRAESIAAASETRFRLLVQGVTDYAIYMLDPDGRVSNWNAGAERAKGYIAAEIVGQDFARFYSEEDRRNGLPQKALEIARTEGKFESEGWRYRKDGSCFWAYVVIDPIYDENHALIGYAKITKDITKQKADADHIRRVTHNLDIALENMSQGICLFDADERLVLANRRYSEIFRLPDGLVQPGLTYREIVATAYQFHRPASGNYEHKAAEHYDRSMAIVRQGAGTQVLKLPQDVSIQVNINAIQEGGWVVTVEDITERLRSEEQIAFMAQHDGLTGLPNRSAFNDRLAQELVVAKRTSSSLAVIGIDLDRFKEINDQRGHATGDRVLVALGERLSATSRDEEFVARFGGDEFAAFKRFDDMPELHDFLGRLRRALFEAMVIDGFEIMPSASMGVALYPQDAGTAETLLANADLAMYRAKAALREDTCFYEVTMDEAIRSRNGLANDLWTAIGKGQFHLHYQVQKSVRTSGTTGYEVLLRWTHPERDNISPMDFIPLAEECGAILPIGEWVLREACREAASWREPHKIAVNLSPVQLAHADIAALVQSILRETGLDAGRLELEITETSIIADKERALRTLKEIKGLGVSVAIDDFGTGYSSLETLRAFPFDKIKLDRGFIKEVEESPQAKAIVRAILALGRSLSVPVLAEGVETEVQLAILLDEGCDEAQGYLLGRPAPIRDIVDSNGISVQDTAQAAAA
jgi:diguanylate cyclase (GGDEF)-like protein/PAS domain S-box-containing protein